MGNSNEKARLMYEHEEEMAQISNMKDIREKEILLKEKMEQYNLEKHKAEIERLANLDRLHYQAELKQLEAQIRKNDQMHERELQKIKNDFLNNQKALDNDRQKINNIHEENLLLINNRHNIEENKLKLDFQLGITQLKNQELEIRLNAQNEKDKNDQIYQLNKYKLQSNHEMKCIELNNIAKQNNEKHQENLIQLNNKHIENLKEIVNRDINEKKKLDYDREIKMSEIDRKKKRDTEKFEIKMVQIKRQMEKENNQYKFESKKMEKTYDNQMLKEKQHHELVLKESEKQTKILEDQGKERIMKLENERVKLETEKELEKIKIQNEYELKKKQMENEEKDKEEEREIRRQQRQREDALFYKQLEAQTANINIQIYKAFNSINQKGQENSKENSNLNNFPIPFINQSFNNMGMGMNNSEFGFSFNNMMNMMNNNNK